MSVSKDKGRDKKFRVISLEHTRRKKQQLRAASGGGDGGGADYHNQLYKLTENVQSLEEKVVHVERMLRKLLRLLRNTSQRDQSP
jgi:hypothetical protein